MSDPTERGAANPAGALGQPVIDPDKLKAFGSQLAQATADLEAMRTLKVVPEFGFTFDGARYTVTMLGQTVADPFLSRAILLAAQQAGVAPPKSGDTEP